MIIYPLWIVIIKLLVTSAIDNHDEVFTNTWVVEIDGHEDKAKEIAKENGFTFIGPVGSLDDMYLIEHKEVSKRSKRSADEYHLKLDTHKHVRYAEQQKLLSRTKRGFSDPLFKEQWYLRNTGQTRARCAGYPGFERLDINVQPVWKKNITGRGVVVSILDDGLEHVHPDLRKNYDARASYDFNGNKKDPSPRYTADRINKHGTRCAGEVAGERGNGVCGSGVAFNARVGGIRMLDGDVTDAVEAGSLSYAPDIIDIYSSSWGPDDDGRTVDGPGPLAQKAFKKGIATGRKGRGSIFVWATGNGGRFGDVCSCDGYINSPYTISIGAVDNCGRKPWYSEPCPGTFAVTYSSGESSGLRDKQIATTDLGQTCTTKHTGTSAAAPLAAGIFALVLEANPKVTWRDLQHLVARSSKVISPKDSGWQTNGAGLKVNVKFGFGVLDTSKLVELATSREWKTAKPRHTCESDQVAVDLKPYKNQQTIESVIKSDGCNDMENCVTKLEHVHVVVTLQFKGRRNHRRGQHTITLTSPSGTKSDVLLKRNRDTTVDKGFEDWEFLSLFHWDENPRGKWKLSVTDYGNSDWTNKVFKWRLKLYGTCDIKGLFDIHINESEICDTHCKSGCPSPQDFAKHCIDCSQYCDCTIGECVPVCDEKLVSDNQLRHCKRSMERTRQTRNEDSPSGGTTGKFSLPTKFAVAALALLLISIAITAVAYFTSKVYKANGGKIGYHSVKNYPVLEEAWEGEGDFTDEERTEKEKPLSIATIS